MMEFNEFSVRSLQRKKESPMFSVILVVLALILSACGSDGTMGEADPIELEESEAQVEETTPTGEAPDETPGTMVQAAPAQDVEDDQQVEELALTTAQPGYLKTSCNTTAQDCPWLTGAGNSYCAPTSTCTFFCDEPVISANCLTQLGLTSQPTWPDYAISVEKDPVKSEKYAECIWAPASYRPWQPAVDNCTSMGGTCTAVPNGLPTNASGDKTRWICVSK